MHRKGKKFKQTHAVGLTTCFAKDWPRKSIITCRGSAFPKGDARSRYLGFCLLPVTDSRLSRLSEIDVGDGWRLFFALGLFTPNNFRLHFYSPRAAYAECPRSVRWLRFSAYSSACRVTDCRLPDRFPWIADSPCPIVYWYHSPSVTPAGGSVFSILVTQKKRFPNLSYWSVMDAFLTISLSQLNVGWNAPVCVCAFFVAAGQDL